MNTSSDLVVVQGTFLDITRTFRILLYVRVDRGTVASVATRYRLNGIGFESRVGGATFSAPV